MTGFRRCSNDPNRARALLKFADGTIFIESKLGLDIDGSGKACGDPGTADQCATWFEWPDLPKPARFVDSDRFPYVVIPIAGLRGRSGGSPSCGDASINHLTDAPFSASPPGA